MQDCRSGHIVRWEKADRMRIFTIPDSNLKGTIDDICGK